MQRLRRQRADALTRYDDAKTATTASGDADAAVAVQKNAELQRVALYRAVTLSSSVSAGCS
jgi:hypothetical protein